MAKWGSRLERICEAVTSGHTRRDLIDALRTNNETLQNIDRQFMQILNRFHIYFFHEGKPTKVAGTMQFVCLLAVSELHRYILTLTQIVDEESASPNVPDVERAGIQADHSHMCKFENDNAPGFDLVADGIQRYAAEALGYITRRWEAEKRERGLRRDEVISEMAMLYPGMSRLDVILTRLD